MQLTLFLTSHGKFVANDKTLMFILPTNEKHSIPISQVRDIYSFGKVSLSSGAIDLLSQNGIPFHVHTENGFHISSVLPKRGNESGKVLVEQVKAHLDEGRRLEIAHSIIEACKHNILKTLNLYNNRGKKVSEISSKISGLSLQNTTIDSLLGYEANIWKNYYKSFDLISGGLKFESRSYHPPLNKFNSLLSLSHSLLYSTMLTVIYQTPLNPSISYLHTPQDKRFSLSLDISEIYKPLISHRLVFKLINRKQITAKSFSSGKGYRLKDNYFKLFLQEYQNSLQAVVQVGRKKMSVFNIIKHDVLRLLKALLQNKSYKPYREG